MSVRICANILQAYVAILIIPVDRKLYFQLLMAQLSSNTGGMIAMLEHPHLGQTFTIASALIYAACVSLKVYLP